MEIMKNDGNSINEKDRKFLYPYYEMIANEILCEALKELSNEEFNKIYQTIFNKAKDNCIEKLFELSERSKEELHFFIQKLISPSLAYLESIKIDIGNTEERKLYVKGFNDAIKKIRENYANIKSKQ